MTSALRPSARCPDPCSAHTASQPRGSRESVVADLILRLDEALEPLLPRGTRCALLDFPNHPNVGDHAIWLGEKRWLREHGIDVVYACDIETYRPDKLSRVLGQGTILLHGGGNLGDLWLDSQWFRERVLEDFPRNRIIQLPQTIHFTEDWSVGMARGIFDAHPDFTLLCRDTKSLEFARREFAGRSMLCPDMALYLGAVNSAREPQHEIVWLARSDLESAGQSVPPVGEDVHITDWLEEEPTATSELQRQVALQILADPEDWEPLQRSLSRTFDRLARQRLRRGCRILGSGRVVITDRLHGHLLCLLMGIPHVLLDNSYGKLRNFFDTWTSGTQLAHWAASPADALELARSLTRSLK